MIRKSFFIIGSLVILIVVFLLFPKKVMVEDIFGDNYLDQDAGVSVQTINSGDIITIDVSEEKQQELISLIESLEFKKSDESYGPLDAKYIVTSKSNTSNKAYLFAEENIVVFSSKSSRGYIVQNEKVIQEIVDLLP